MSILDYRIGLSNKTNKAILDSGFNLDGSEMSPEQKEEYQQFKKDNNMSSIPFSSNNTAMVSLSDADPLSKQLGITFNNLPPDSPMRTDTRIVAEEYGLEPYDYGESELMRSDTTSKEGILKTFFKALGSGAADYIRDGGLIGRSIRGIGSLFGDAYKKSRFYNPITASGNRLFAPGARAGDRANLGLRRDARRFANMINRLAAGKRIGRSNLEKIMARRGLTGIDVEGMADSIAQSAKTGYGVGDVGGGDTGLGAGGGGRDYSSSPGAMAGDMEYGEE